MIIFKSYCVHVTLASDTAYLSVSWCVYARQPLKVLNGLSDQHSKSFFCTLGCRSYKKKKKSMSGKSSHHCTVENLLNTGFMQMSYYSLAGDVIRAATCCEVRVKPE